MIEEQAFRKYLLGLILGGGAGFLLHKNLKISKGLGIAIGSALGFVVTMQMMKVQQKKQIELLNDKMKPSQSKSLKSRQYSMECEMRYSELRQPSVMMPPEYWEKRKEDWMKINCK